MTTQSIDTRQDFEDVLGRSVVARLSESADVLPHDIAERLKVARTLALSKRKIIQTQTQPVAAVSASGSAVALPPHSGGPRLRNLLGSLLPLAALVAGLLLISFAQDSIRADEIAEVDTELLTNDLPPAAFTDPGFNQFLRTLPRGE